MNQAVLGITITYVALAALLLGIFFHSRVHVWIKFTCLIMVTSFYYLTYTSLQGVLGWPTQQELPKHFQLMAATITEPDESIGEKGRIHLWLTSFVDSKPADDPRAFEMPYELDLHKAVDQALSDQKRGRVKLGRSEEIVKGSDIPKDWTRYGQKRQKLKFFDLPDPELPEK